MKILFLIALIHVALMSEPARATDAPTANGLVAHEWGTFTSVQGSDGTPIRWNPFQTAELPTFVYNRQCPDRHSAFASLQNLVGKVGPVTTAWLQRMETPVIYFYTNQPLTVDVSVKFPDGLITEWYPQVRQFGPAPALPDMMPASNESFVSWKQLQLLPGAQSDTSPTDGSHSHYFAARETDSTPLRAAHGLTQTRAAEQEKFLFYRGAGNFAAPLQVRFEGEREIVLENTGREPLHRLFIFELRGGSAAFVSAGDLAGGAKAKIALPHAGSAGSIDTAAREISRAMEKSLIAEGLYPREAAAVVKTWRDSWFAENGIRVLYLLPSSWTDRVLPLEISPAPAQLVRVMVGRAEVFTPALERQLREPLALFQNPATRPQAVEAMQELRIGRFIEPALTRLATIAGSTARNDVETLKTSLRAPALVPIGQ